MSNIIDILRGGNGEALHAAEQHFLDVTDTATAGLLRALSAHPGEGAVNMPGLPPMGGIIEQSLQQHEVPAHDARTGEQLAQVLPMRSGVTAVNETVETPEAFQLREDTEAPQRDYADNVLGFPRQGGHIAVGPNVQNPAAPQQFPMGRQGDIAA